MYELEYELDNEFDEEFEFTDEFELEYDDSPFSEAEEMELATELLSISDDDELEMFLGKLFKQVSRKVRRAVKSPIFRSVMRLAKPLIKKALPIVGGAIGSFVAPGVGTAIGSAAGNVASRWFEMDMEFEALSSEDQEFEVARRVVRLMGSTAKNAAKASPRGKVSTIAKKSLVKAARVHAPGLLRQGKTMTSSGRGRSGRWVRRERNIVILAA